MLAYSEGVAGSNLTYCSSLFIASTLLSHTQIWLLVRCTKIEQTDAMYAKPLQVLVLPCTKYLTLVHILDVQSEVTHLALMCIGTVYP